MGSQSTEAEIRQESRHLQPCDSGSVLNTSGIRLPAGRVQWEEGKKTCCPKTRGQRGWGTGPLCTDGTDFQSSGECKPEALISSFLFPLCALGVLVPQRRAGLRPSAGQPGTPHHHTTREFPGSSYF